MSDRRLVVTELDPADPHYGEVFALATNNATAVPVPAFRFGNAKPPVGSAVGEAFYETTTRQGYVWDGATWKDIAANPILQFATDTDLLRDTTSAVGSYAISASTGNLYVKRTAGWSRVGVALYPTVTDLLNDNPTVGTLGEALDEGSLWERATGGWRITGPRGLPNTAAVQAWAAKREVHTFTVTTPASAVGTEVVGATFDGGAPITVTAAAGLPPAGVAASLVVALLTSLPSTFKVDYTPGQTTIVVRGPATGAPVVVTALQNMTDAVTPGKTAYALGANVGDTALAIDVDVAYMRTPSGWRPVTIWEDTEANIRASTWALNGQEAIASDTGRTFVRIQGNWIEEPIQHYTTEAALLAATPPNGTLAWSDDTQVVFTRAGGTWHRMGSPTMTFGTTAPATPAAGDLWYDNNNNRRTLNIWNGTAWISTTGVTINSAGAKVIIPGYFNVDPSDTATAVDIGGLAFRYYSGQTQLFLNKGTAWNPMTPMLGVAANAGKPVIADANGNMSWGAASKFQERTLAFGDDGGSGAWIDTTANGGAVAEKYFCIEGTITVTTGNFDVAPYLVQDDNAVIDFHVDRPFENTYHLTTYEAGGTRDVNPTFQNNHGSRWTFKMQDSYHCKSATSLTFVFKGYRTTTGFWQLYWEGGYRSSNDTPMRFSGGTKLNAAHAMKGFGVQTFAAGGLETGHAEGYLVARWQTVA
jgi:hypothetical protein